MWDSLGNIRQSPAEYTGPTYLFQPLSSSGFRQNSL
jgi:hypothetical protein